MRVIFNIPSAAVAKAVGWRAKAVEIGEKNEAALEEVLKAVKLPDNSDLHDLLVEEGHVKNRWVLYVNGARLTASSNLAITLKDNVQIHIMDNPRTSL